MSAECPEAFESLKYKLINSSVLQYPNFLKRLISYASKFFGKQDINKSVKEKDIPTVKNIRQVSITQKKLAIDPKRQISMIDLLIENNSEELENMYKDNSLNEDLKKKQTNDLLEENNTLLSEKIELTNAEKD